MAKLGPDNARVTGAVAVADFLGINVPKDTSACKVAEAIRCNLAATYVQHINALEMQLARLQLQISAQQTEKNQSDRKLQTLRKGNALACAQRDDALRAASKAIQERDDVLELLSRSHAQQAGPPQGTVTLSLLPRRGEPVPPVQESGHRQQTQPAVLRAGRP